MNIERIREIANAVLYEGYLLYPYQRSAIKNQQRWTFGVVYPRAYSDAQGGDTDPWTMRTECLVLGDEQTALDATVRFLHLLTRTSLRDGQANTQQHTQAQAGNWGGDSWDEAVEREVPVPTCTIGELVERERLVEFAFPAAHLEESAPDTDGPTIVRDQRPLAGTLVLTAAPVEGGDAAPPAYRLSLRIENTTPLPDSGSLQRQTALQQSFVSTHTLLCVSRGAFASLLDPPDSLAEAARACQNRHTWPVLVGHDGDTDTLLSSPIILYDYPQIAPESPGALFDGTEIDELLTLRILALTDEEKEEMRRSDARAREILERTESLSVEQLMKMHGVIRSLGPSAVEGGGG